MSTLATRLTIGYINSEIHREWAVLPWRGIVDAAQQQNVNLITFVGKLIAWPEYFEEQGNVLYNLAAAERVDGLIIWKNGMFTRLTESAIEAFCGRSGLPVVTLDGTVSGRPCVTCSTYHGMRLAVDHLLDVHGYQRLGYVGCLEHHSGFQKRFQAYTDALIAHGLPVDPALIQPYFPDPAIAPTGMVEAEIFQDCVQRILHAGATAIVGANDIIAIQMLNLFQAQGVRVPEDVALVGFDDFTESAVVSPPLTSVNASLYALGQQAVQTLLDLLAGQTVPAMTMVPAYLSIRRSCGCTDAAIARAADMGSHALQTTLVDQPATARAMIQAGHFPEPPTLFDSFERLIEKFWAEVTGEKTGAFLLTLEHLIEPMMLGERESAEWQDALSILRQQALPWLSDGEAVARAETLWQQARLLIGQTAERRQAYQRFRIEKRAQQLREVGQALITTFDVRELLDILAERLPGLGIPGCYLAFYEDPPPYAYPDPAPEWSRLVLAYNKRGRGLLESGGQRFPSCHICPPEFWPDDQPVNLIAEPLYFREQQIGFILFEPGPREGNIYEALRSEISSALQGALLVQRVQQHAQELAESNQRLQLANAAAEAARQSAEAANQAKSAFLAHMSHELRTPLNGILGYADILRRRVGNDSPLADGLDIIWQSGEHLLTLINDVLDLARIEAGKIDLHPVPIDLAAFLLEILGIVRARAEAKHLTLRYEEASPLPAAILADETRLRQVLLNLLGNAIKFTDRGQVTLRVWTLDTGNSPFDVAQGDSHGERSRTIQFPVSIRFAVDDTGPGIAPEQLERIFEPFEQAGGIAKRTEGAGLGLAISRQLVQRMGGHLQVMSPAFPAPLVGGIEGGPGSAFWFDVVVPVTAIAAQAAPPPAREIVGYAGARRTVLVVDDTLYNRLVLHDMLAPLGFVVHTAEDGQQAIDQAVAVRPDVILMDLVLPVKTGIEAVQEIRQQPEGHAAVIIAVSASVQDADRAKSLVAGCNAFLPKPIQREALLETLAAQLTLAWQYAEPQIAPDMPLIPPPPEELAALAEFAQFGRLVEIRQAVRRIADLDDRYRPFVETLHPLIRAVDMARIIELVDQFRSEEAQ